MIVINKTRAKIGSHHRRGDFLNPGRNTLDDASLSRSERAYIDALVKSRIVEIEVEAPEPTPPPPPPIVAQTEPLALTTATPPGDPQPSKRRPRKPQE